jgi:threonine dehydratase
LSGDAPNYTDILDAADRIEPAAVPTPLLAFPALDARVGGRVLLKAELAQRTGSFKFRGALNRMRRIAPQRQAAGVVAYSSGNHAQAVAAVAKLLGMPAVIVMPSDAPAVKIERTRGHGAVVVLYDREREDREAIGARIAAERGATIVAPYEDRDVIAGQGTAGLELVKQAEALDDRADAVLVPTSGGGLVAGVALAVKERWPDCAVYAVEPEGHDDTTRSLAARRRLVNPPGTRSICDALLAPTPGAISFAVNSRLLAGGIVVPDSETLAAMGYAKRALDLELEPAGAIALAAVLSGRFAARGRTVAVVLSGGNVEPVVLERALAATV